MRFTHFDPVTNGNLYHYAGNNPVRYVDPDGNEDEYAESEKNALFVYIKDVTKQEPTDIINDFNKNHPNNKISENTLCELFADADKSKALLMEREGLHKDLRYQLNDKAPKTESEAKKAEMKKLPFIKSIFHNPLKNNKYVSSDGHMEGVYNKKSSASDDRKLYMATFNFFDPNTKPSEHKKADVDPYVKWGN